MTSLAASERAIYSDSVDDNATVVCLFDDHDSDMAPIPKNTAYPPVDFLPSVSLAKSASE
jgi:hypothetical protein